jgi:PPOX class probable F420-dependent enzyme
MRTGLTAADLPGLLEEPVIGVLATRRPDDSILLSPVWWEWRDGGFSIWVESEEDRKIRHLRRDPRTTFVVANDTWPYTGLEIRGEARITQDDFFGVLRRTAERFLGPEAAERMATTSALGLVIRVEPGIVRGWSYDDE